MPDTRRTFHHQLDEVQRDLLRAGGPRHRVHHARHRSAPHPRPRRGAGDHRRRRRVNQLTLDVEERCFTILARQQPMASDMRAVVTAIRLTSEIERSGDLMVNVAKAARRLYGSTVAARRSTASCRRWPTRASASSAWRWTPTPTATPTVAGALDDMDDRLDDLHRDYIQAILEHYADVARRAGGGAAGARGPLLRAHRRPRREHRRAGAVHGHGLAARAHRRATGGRAA